MAAEFKGKVAFNSLWPKTIISTAAIEFAIGNAAMLQLGRKGSIMADAASAILQKDAKTVSGNFYIDEDVLRAEGVTDFAEYRVNPNTPENQLLPDFFI
jgi:citronellol/citronellal dehydrogenase